jgi:hypothetical protein
MILIRTGINAVSLAGVFFVYPILVLSLAGVPYSETVHRLTTVKTFDSTLFGSPDSDAIAVLGFSLLFAASVSRSRPYMAACAALFGALVGTFALGSVDAIRLSALASLPSIALLLAVSAAKNTPKLAGSEAKLAVCAFLSMLVMMESLALARWAVHPAAPTEAYSDTSWSPARLESSLFHSFALLSPWLALLASFAFLYRPHFSMLFATLGRRRNAAGNNEVIAKTADGENAGLPQASPAGKAAVPGWLLLVAALVIAPMITFYPHIQSINPDQGGVSTDERYYLDWLAQLRASGSYGIQDAFRVNNGERPLTLLIMAGLADLTGAGDKAVIRYLPVALAPALVASSYFLVRKNLHDRERGKKVAGWAALFAALAPQVVVGMYAGLLANWMALVAGNFALHFMIRAWEGRERGKVGGNVACLSALLALIALLHVYTWGHFAVAAVVFAAISYVTSRRSVSIPGLKALVIILAVTGVAGLEVAKSLYSDGPAGLGHEAGRVGAQLNLGNFDSHLANLFHTFGSYVGGYLSNPVVWALVLVWAVRSKYSRTFDRVLLAMLFVIAIPALFGGVEFQTRVIHNTPLHLMALLALPALGSGGRLDATSALVLAAVVLGMATYDLRAMANLYLVVPEGYEIGKPVLIK